MITSTADAYPMTPLQAGMVFHSELDPGSAVYLAARGVTPGDVVGVAGCEVVVAESGEQTGTLWVNLSSSSPVSRRWECLSRRRVPSGTARCSASPLALSEAN